MINIVLQKEDLLQKSNRTLLRCYKLGKPVCSQRDQFGMPYVSIENCNSYSYRAHIAYLYVYNI